MYNRNNSFFKNIRNQMIKIPCILYRGGTSKGPVFLKSDLPDDEKLRDQVLLNLMGSPHIRQIDGLGCGDSLSSKAVIISPSDKKDVDVDYLLCQIHIDKPIVETTLNCGNMLSTVAPFAIEKGLVKATSPETVVKIFNVNTGVVMHATVQTPNGLITYDGQTTIDGVPGSAAPIKLSFLNAVGSKTGKLLPTGNVTDYINDVEISCVDVAVPMVIVNARDLNMTGYETKEELDSDLRFMQQLEAIGCEAALKMGLGEVKKSISPKICIVSAPKNNGTINSRYFTPFDCHSSHAVSGSLCLAAACLIKGSVANKTANINIELGQYERDITIEHVSGSIMTSINLNNSSEQIDFPFASFIRTARPLFEGHVIISASKFQIKGGINHARP